MKKIFKKWTLPICLLLIILMQIYSYINGSRVETAMFVVVVALLPKALKSLEFNISNTSFKLFQRITLILAVVLLVYTLWLSM
tara:strand:+ start:82 stop:330 length:249 start_codon:yes stop_codon:yes gene_type:complete